MSINLLMFWSALFVLCVASARWGGWPERRISLMYLSAAVATALVRSTFTVRYANVEPGTFVVDTLLFIGLAVVTARWDRWWTICATAFQGLAVLAHVGKAINPDLSRFGYQLMAVWSAWPALLALASGIVAEASRRRRRAGAT